MRAVDNDLWLCDHLLLEAHVDAQVLLTPEIGLIYYYEFDAYMEVPCSIKLNPFTS